jgi:hypothetical protein
MNITNISNFETQQDEPLRSDVSALIASFRLTAQAAMPTTPMLPDAVAQHQSTLCMRDPYFSFELI